jgi:hypothetical protein
LPQIKLDDLDSEKALLGVLTPEVLDQTARLFAIRSQWLEGIDDKIYEYLYCYKEPQLFIEKFFSLSRGENNMLRFPIRAITSTKNLDYSSSDYQPLVLVMVELAAMLGDEMVYRYYVFRDGMDWSYSPARIQIKAMIRAIGNYPVPLFIASQSEIEQLFEGARIPHRFVKGCQITNPSLEDYVCNGSAVAKEVDELPEVDRYIEEYELDRIVARMISASEVATTEGVMPEVISAPVPLVSPSPKSGKRAENTKILWEPVSSIAQAWWAKEGDSLSIAVAVRRIKAMSHLPASSLGESVIRKRIAKFAPENVRKSGRKPNKST